MLELKNIIDKLGVAERAVAVLFIIEEYTLFGLQECLSNAKLIAGKLSNYVEQFDTELILNEALSNAFYHGNKGDRHKPINLKISIDTTRITFEIRDCGTGFDYKPISISAENLLAENGRGLFLIKAFSDSVRVFNNILIIDIDYKKRKVQNGDECTRI